MRQPQKSNRARGRGGRKGGGGGGGNSLNRVYESAGPEGKVRGTPQQIVEKYLSLARDAQTSGDRVMGENFLQHAEHYQRIVLQVLGAQEERRDGMASDADDDEDDDDVQAAPHGHRAPEQRPQEHRGHDQQHRGHEQRQQRAQHHGNGRDHVTASTEPLAVSPLTTIDLSEEDATDLLVATDEHGSSPAPATAAPAPAPTQARRPRRPRGRRPAGEDAPQPEAPAPAAQGGDTD